MRLLINICFLISFRVIKVFPLSCNNKLTLCFLRCDNIEKLKAQLPKMEQELKDQGKFKDFYQFTFIFAKNPGQKGLGKTLLMSPFNLCFLIDYNM